MLVDQPDNMEAATMVALIKEVFVDAQYLRASSGMPLAELALRRTAAEIAFHGGRSDAFPFTPSSETLRCFAGRRERRGGAGRGNRPLFRNRVPPQWAHCIGPIYRADLFIMPLFLSIPVTW